MPEDEFDDEFQPIEGENDVIRQLRSKANKASKLEKQNSELAAKIAVLEQRSAFTDAGLTLSDKQQKALLAAHDGEFNREALRSTAAELGFITLDEPDEDAQRRETALATQGVIADASRGSRPPAGAPNLSQQILAADQAGDLKLKMRLKAQAFEAQKRATQR